MNLPVRRAAAALTALLAFALAACGSELDPNTVAQVNGTGGSVGSAAAGVDAPQAAGSAPAGGPAAARGDTPSGGSGQTSTAGGGAGGDLDGQGDNSATGGGKAAGCQGFKNQTGITDDKIVIANVSDISGPVPGLFQSSQDAVRAYVAYFNQNADICGRKLEVLNLDSRTDAGAGQQAYTQACDQAFAAVGSMSGFDSGGASEAEKCGLPDLRATSVLPERQQCTTCFGAQSVDSTTYQNAVPDHILKKYPDAAKAAAMVYLNAGAAPPNAANQVKADERRGMDFVYVQGIDVSEFNYAPYVQQMKDKGVKYVQFIGPYQNSVKLAQAMQQQGFKPDVFALDPTGYSPDYVQTGGAAVDGTRVFINIALFNDPNKEVQLYQAWLQQVRPGAEPSYFGAYSWSAARLFVETALKLGGKLSRQSMVQEISRVDDWTGNGLHAPQHVGAKKTSECWRWIRLDGSAWVPDGPVDYTCNGVTSGA
ncbi:ABC transporter substrate-binding protein [Nocardioides sp.]|uniref:ABC transporter substrate-binding protein n=1 Tax=Nocardioides sp. TaxID=35761 RepID=UPI0025DAB652|nr:ABC transporter substrate-binding protein [Nocardioides sp.]